MNVIHILLVLMMVSAFLFFIIGEVVLTANAIAGIKEEYMREGFADYLSKPVKVEKLEEMLAKYLLNNEK